MKPRDYILKQINHEETTPVPYRLPLDLYQQEAMDKFYGSPDWRERAKTFISWPTPYDSWPWKEVSKNRYLDVYGSLWRTDVNGFHQLEPALKDPTLDGYEFPASELFFRPNGLADAAETLKAESDYFSIMVISWGLFERAWQIRGFENALMDAISEPKFYAQLLDKLTDLLLEMVDAVRDIPADAIMFGDNWGYQDGVVMGPDRWRKFIKPRWQKIYEATHAQGKLTISHCDGDVTEIMPDIVEIGLDVLESVQPEAMDPYQLKAQWGDKITFWGALGSQSILSCGTPNTIKTEVARLCREMGKGGGYILSPSKPPLADAPIENIAAAWDAFIDQGANGGALTE